MLCLFHFYKNTKIQNTFTNIILHKKFMKLKEWKNIYIKLQIFYNECRGYSKIPTTSKTEVFPTLFHGRKPLNNVTKSIIPDVVGGPRNLWNIINKTQISFNRITEKIHKHTQTHRHTHTHTNLPPPPHIALKGVFTLCLNQKIT